MASESTQPVELNAIPNSVSGDGTTFVKGLKKYLSGYSNTVEDLIENSGIGQITNIEMSEQHISVNGSNQNNIYITFDTGSITNYAFAQIWITENIKSAWTLDGTSNNSTYTVSNVVAGKTYYVKVIGCNKEAYSNFEKATISSITIDGSSKICNVPTQFFWDNAEKRWVWSGYVDNGYTDYFELRTDANAGVVEGRLDRIDFTLNESYSSATPPSRSGTAYLFVRNIYGDYNSPATHIYAINGLPKPSVPVISGTVDGIVISFGGLPTGAIGYVVDVDGEQFEVTTQQWTYYQKTGTASIKYCFVDSIGKSEWSNTVTEDVGRLIVAGDIDDNAITSSKIMANAITADKVNAGAITSVKLAANAVTAEKISAGAITTTKLDALAVTADKIAGSTITGAKIAANTITANNLNVQNLSSVSATIGTLRTKTSGARVEIKDNLIVVYDSNNKVRVKLGVW